MILLNPERIAFIQPSVDGPRRQARGGYAGFVSNQLINSERVEPV